MNRSEIWICSLYPSLFHHIDTFIDDRKTGKCVTLNFNIIWVCRQTSFTNWSFLLPLQRTFWYALSHRKCDHCARLFITWLMLQQSVGVIPAEREFHANRHKWLDNRVKFRVLDKINIVRIAWMRKRDPNNDGFGIQEFGIASHTGTHAHTYTHTSRHMIICCTCLL